MKKITKVLTYEQWLAENMTAVGVAPEGNMAGTMGNPTPPGPDGKIGSGDTWNSVGKIATQVCPHCRKLKKKCKCKKKTNK